jgi:hypothetical protein
METSEEIIADEYQVRENRCLSADLVNENTHHIALASLEGPKRPSEVELDVILLTLHTDSQEYSTLVALISRLQVQPNVVCQEVAVLGWVQADETTADYVMLAHQRTVPYAAHEPKWLLDADVEGFFPYYRCQSEIRTRRG